MFIIYFYSYSYSFLFFIFIFYFTVAGAFSSVQIAVGESMAEILENISLNWATVLERLSETRGEA